MDNCRIDCTKLSSHSTLFVAIARSLLRTDLWLSQQQQHTKHIAHCWMNVTQFSLVRPSQWITQNIIEIPSISRYIHGAHITTFATKVQTVSVSFSSMHCIDDETHATPSSVNFSTLISYGFGMAVWNATALSTQVSTKSIHMRPAETQVCDIHIVTLVHCNFRRHRNRVPCPYARAIYATQ